jgi:DNA-directed RNA polymerase subunit alpha
MEHIPLPSKVEFIAGANDRAGSVVVEPLFPGYGTTLGNALRRVLLSSLSGAAVTAVKIANASHEFTTLPKVQEDILQIILNLKLLRLRVATDEPVTLTLKAKGERVVTAADITPDSRVEVVNPDLPIATLTSRTAELELTLTVSRGRGYVPTEAREKERFDIGTVAVDAFFSPVRQVSFHVAPARVGQMTNFDKLVLDLETDGTLTPVEAVNAALDILVEQFQAVSASLRGQPATGDLVLGDAAVAPAVAGGEGAGEEASAAPDPDEEKATKKKRPSRKKAAT